MDGYYLAVSTELVNLQIDEASGVDAPAHSIPGWMVMKNSTPEQAAEAQLAALYATIGGASVLDGAPEDIQKAATTLSEFVEKQLTAPEPTLIEKMAKLFKGTKPAPAQVDDDDDDDDTNKAPKVKKAKKEKKVVAPADGTNDSSANVEPDVFQKALEPMTVELDEIRKAYTADMDAMREIIAKAFERIENLEAELTGSYQPSGQEGTAPVEKSAPSLSDGIMSAFSGNRVTLS